MGIQGNHRRVDYEVALVAHIDILGFRELINQRTPGEISKIFRVFTEAIGPAGSKLKIPEMLPDQFISFSDLIITMLPLQRANTYVKGKVFFQLLRLVHAQATLISDHSILIRGGVVVGKAAKSYRRIFGPAVIRAFDVESKEAIYPRIVIDQSVIDEVSTNPRVWMHGGEAELSAIKNLLRKDDENGLYYIDYLRVIREELDNPGYYEEYLATHNALIAERLSQYPIGSDVRRKYEWMERYQRRVVRVMKRRE